MQRNSYCSLKAPSLFLSLEILTLSLFIHYLQLRISSFGLKIRGTDGETRQTLHLKLGKRLFYH